MSAIPICRRYALRLLKCFQVVRKASFCTRYTIHTEIPGAHDNSNVLQKNEEITLKLNDLLQKMLKENADQSATSSIHLSKPKDRRKNLNELNYGEEVANERSVNTKKVRDALPQLAKKVAELLGGDTKRTESELLQKLRADCTSQKAKLPELIKDMIIEKDYKLEKEKYSRSMEVKMLLQQVEMSRHRIRDRQYISKTNLMIRPHITARKKLELFGVQKLNIFNTEALKISTEGLRNKTFDQLWQRELNFSVTHPALNYFQEMIRWTEERRIWKFPIDNEQDFDEEKEISFTEHIFLEKHLEGWCPARGPIRHFMELVCVGLSKNPYLTIADKKEHILWYRDYFKEKENLLQDVGALDMPFSSIT